MKVYSHDDSRVTYGSVAAPSVRKPVIMTHPPPSDWCRFKDPYGKHEIAVVSHVTRDRRGRYQFDRDAFVSKRKRDVYYDIDHAQPSDSNKKSQPVGTAVKFIQPDHTTLPPRGFKPLYIVDEENDDDKYDESPFLDDPKALKRYRAMRAHKAYSEIKAQHFSDWCEYGHKVDAYNRRFGSGRNLTSIRNDLFAIAFRRLFH